MMKTALHTKITLISVALLMALALDQVHADETCMSPYMAKITGQ